MSGRSAYSKRIYFFTVDYFSVTAFIDFAAAMSAYVETWFNGDCDKSGKAFEESSAQFPAFQCELKDFFLFFANRLFGMCD